MSVVTKKVAIVGAGPAGFYTADALLRLADWIRIDLIDRLPIPFGLVRYGVAGDHLGTKSVVRVFERIMKQDRVRYFGNVEVGKSISWDDLQSCYDTVVIATGANEGCVVQIPGHDLYNSITAIDLMQWMNGHPDHPEVPFSGRPHSVVIIGNGNVSLDVARVFAKSDHELRQSDIPGSVLQVLDGHTVDDIHICGRRGLDEARFAPNELAELCRLSEARISISPDVAGLLRESAEPCARSDLREVIRRATTSGKTGRTRIHFHFMAVPQSYDGRLACFGGAKELRIQADLLVHAIGQRGRAVKGLPFDSARGWIPNDDGVVAGFDHLFAVGWACGPARGGIASTRAAAYSIAKVIEQSLACRPRRSGYRRLDEFLMRDSVVVSDWQAWLHLDAQEILAGQRSGRVREKLTGWPSINAALHSRELNETRGVLSTV